MFTEEDKCHHSILPLSSSSPFFIYWAWCHILRKGYEYMRSICWIRWGQPSQLRHLQDACVVPAAHSSLAGWCEEQKKAWMCNHCSPAAVTSLCFKMQSHTNYCDENGLYCSQNQPRAQDNQCWTKRRQIYILRNNGPICLERKEYFKSQLTSSLVFQ